MRNHFLAENTQCPGQETRCAETQRRSLAHPSPVSERMWCYDADYYRDSLRKIIGNEQYDVVIVGYVWLSGRID